MKERCKRVLAVVKKGLNNFAKAINGVNPLWYAIIGLFLHSVFFLVLAIIVLFQNEDEAQRSCCNEPKATKPKAKRVYKKKAAVKK
jgi:hypothetical protein